jgi:hypothetical protein
MSDERDCCIGAAFGGPERCTCWTNTYDAEQAPWDGSLPTVRSVCCGDCASRPDSPERVKQGGRVWESVKRQARFGGAPFFCHCGEGGGRMRRRLSSVNDVDGRVQAPEGDDYRPGSVRHEAGMFRLLSDGSAAPVCAAWAAMAKACGWVNPWDDFLPPMLPTHHDSVENITINQIQPISRPTPTRRRAGG